MRFRLIPTDDKFFALFNDSATNVAECARRLRDVLAEPTNVALHEKVAACEHDGDEIVHTILQRLNTTFVTPFDREDIHALAEEPADQLVARSGRRHGRRGRRQGRLRRADR